ncbi:hypothetical protein PGT21_037009 [Puccinia graminis f. sp. tritici]|uniref:Uncharacterized protein n=1 Tax=Puccinia graminis f. sp. tritici TaxID=56615 RepID=A0A5B0R3D2_PUCGR|nr:hypothetical protein PGT21_037009 [Puccinia graminis f. sp. tritici]
MQSHSASSSGLPPLLTSDVIQVATTTLNYSRKTGCLIQIVNGSSQTVTSIQVKSKGFNHVASSLQGSKSFRIQSRSILITSPSPMLFSYSFKSCLPPDSVHKQSMGFLKLIILIAFLELHHSSNQDPEVLTELHSRASKILNHDMSSS